MHSRFVATISQENQFSLSQINEDTLLVYIDEWSSNLLDEDTMKLLLQGQHFLFAIIRFLIHDITPFISINSFNDFHQPLFWA